MVWPINMCSKCFLIYNYFILDTSHPGTLYMLNNFTYVIISRNMYIKLSFL
jgi:hypothetical protein